MNQVQNIELSNKFTLGRILAFALPRVLLFISISFVMLFFAEMFLPFEFLSLNIHTVIILIFVSIFIESKRASGKYWSFGIKPDLYALKDSVWGLSVAIAAMLFYANIALFSGVTTEINTISFVQIIIGSITVLGIAAGEELIFRGLLFQTLIEKINPIAAAVILSLLFAFFHIYNPNVNTIGLINIFLAGLMFSTMYIKTKSLWMPISFHFTWNWTQQYLIGSPVSGIYNIDYIYRIYYPEGEINDIFFGGNFGVEGGIICTFSLILIITAVAFFAKSSPYIEAVFFKRRYAESILKNTKHQK